MSDDFTFTDVPRTLPDDVSPVDGPTCDVCGVQIDWAGRGRRPRKCAEHKANARTGGTSSRSVAKNEALAAQATEALIQVNGLVAFLCFMGQLPVTGDAIKTREDVFRNQAQAALVTDPDLCRAILRGGGMSAKLSLALAYGMLGVAVVPVGVLEFKELRAPRHVESDVVQD